MITVVGLGFVGLTTALGFAEKGCKVFGVDSNEARIRAYRERHVPFHEPGLEEALARHSGANFIPTGDLTSAVAESDVVFYCVGTPCADDGAADLSQLFKAFDDCVPGLLHTKRFRVLVVKSTVPPGTAGTRFAAHVASRGFTVGTDLGIASNPEFLREGYAWRDFMEPDRIVVGTSDERSAAILRRIYGAFAAPLHCVSPNTSEFIKYLSNSMLATMISFANEMSMIAHRIGEIDIRQAFRVLHEDKRWSGQPANMASYVFPGCGYGGYCLPKDTLALHRAAREGGHDARLLEQVMRVNDEIKEFLVDKACAGLPSGATLGILGLAFKPNSDDVRDSPAAAVIRRLMQRGVDRILAYDPVANAAFAAQYDFPMSYAQTLEEVVERSDRILILTAWPQFSAAAALRAAKNVYDFRYCLG